MSKLALYNAEFVSNEHVGGNIYLMKLVCAPLASSIKAGQFVHLQLPCGSEHLLRRPFSVYRSDPQSGVLEILYAQIGEGTRLLAQLDARHVDTINMIGAIGNSWQDMHPVCERDRVLLVGAGLGSAPLYMWARYLHEHSIPCDAILAARSAEYLCTRLDYQRIVSSLTCTTDDGSFGIPGTCIPVVERLIKEAQNQGTPYTCISVCGPSIVMKLVSNLAHDFGIFCQVSLERSMACGIGACLSCTADTHCGKKRVCIDGPVFDASELVW